MDLNTTSLCGESVQLYIFQPWVQGLLITLYVVIFVIGIGGNLLVLAVVLGNKHMRTPINIYLLNLSASDIIMCLFSIPMAPTTTFFGHWVFGAALCKILPLGQNMSVHMSTFTLTAIAVDRQGCVLSLQHPNQFSVQNRGNHTFHKYFCHHHHLTVLPDHED